MVNVLVARRRSFDEDRALTPQQLQEYREQIEELSEHELIMQYKTRHHVCEYRGMHVPPPRIIQEFVQLWKRSYKVRGKRKQSR